MTLDIMLAEIVTGLTRVTTLTDAISTGRRLRGARRLRIEGSTPEDHAAAFDDLERYGDPKLSFADCVASRSCAGRGSGPRSRRTGATSPGSRGST